MRHLAILSLAIACGGAPEPSSATEGGGSSTSVADASSTTTGSGSQGTSTADATTTGADGSSSSNATSDEGSSTGEPPDPGPDVDLSDPQLYEFMATPDEIDAAATTHLGTQLAALDTRVTPVGRLVVFLHGAGTPQTCGSLEHGRMLAGLGFHVLQPCYASDYGVGNCGDDIGGCRLEAFEGIDHHPFIDISAPNAAEVRVARMLEWLQQMHPGGDWQYFVHDARPRWDHIVISGISHGASSSGVIAKNRIVERAVMLSGPLDTDQAWLAGPSMTAIERFWAFTHTADDQHAGHLAAFDDLQLVGLPTSIDGAVPPFDGSHRLVTSAATGDGHSSTQAGGASPTDGDAWTFEPVWRTMYGADE